MGSLERRSFYLTEVGKRLGALQKAFDESKHPRDAKGRFGEGNLQALTAETRRAATRQLFFHGTSEEALGTIWEYGLVPDAGRGAHSRIEKIYTEVFGPNAGKLLGKFLRGVVSFGARKQSVYMTPDKQLAAKYAKFIGQHIKSEPVMLRVRFPTSLKDHLIRDTFQQNAFRFKGTIPPQWIDTAVYAGLKSSGKPKMQWRPLSETTQANRLLGEVRRIHDKLMAKSAAEGNTVYVVIPMIGDLHAAS